MCHKTDPIFAFELPGAVADVCWAPYSGTTFGAVTEEGKVGVAEGCGVMVGGRGRAEGWWKRRGEG